MLIAVVVVYLYGMYYLLLLWIERCYYDTNIVGDAKATKRGGDRAKQQGCNPVCGFFDDVKC